MTFDPLIFRVWKFTITGYGIMMMAGFLVAGWTIQRTLRSKGLNEDYASSVVVAAVVGGIVGAKIWYVALTQELGALFSRGGLVWYGGFIGGCLGVALNSWRERVPARLTAEICAPALAIGYALGRFGCFLVQDDYGIPTTLPWGFKFPDGLPPTTAQNLHSLFGVPVPEGTAPSTVLAVHPTQLYEFFAMLAAFFILWRLRDHKHGVGWLFGVYLIFAGVERFLVEILRAKDDRFLGPFTLAQVTSLAVVLVGVAVTMKYRQRDELTIPEKAGVLKPAQV
jgi:phosphatidylglycerol:prolipoprotein diacylglycerol transferase